MKLSMQDFTTFTSSLIETKLSDAAILGELIEVNESFRGFGKTTALLEFAKRYNFAVIVPDGQTAKYIREATGYDLVFGAKESLRGRGFRKVVIDEGVDTNLLEHQNFTVVTGFVRQ